MIKYRFNEVVELVCDVEVPSYGGQTTVVPKGTLGWVTYESKDPIVRFENGMETRISEQDLKIPMRLPGDGSTWAVMYGPEYSFHPKVIARFLGVMHRAVKFAREQPFPTHVIRLLQNGERW